MWKIWLTALFISFHYFWRIWHSFKNMVMLYVLTPTISPPLAISLWEMSTLMWNDKMTWYTFPTKFFPIVRFCTLPLWCTYLLPFFSSYNYTCFLFPFIFDVSRWVGIKIWCNLTVYIFDIIPPERFDL